MSNNVSWEVKWKFIISRLKELIAQKGQEIKVINIDAMMDVKEQYQKFLKTIEKTKTQYDTVITTSLPGEERIFWPYQDVQFYIRKGEEKVQTTGHYEIIQKVFNNT